MFISHPPPSFAPPLVLSTPHSCNSLSSLVLTLVIGCNVLSFWTSFSFFVFFASVLFSAIKLTTCIFFIATRVIEHWQLLQQWRGAQYCAPRIDVTIEELKPMRDLLRAANSRRIPYCKQQKNNKREVYEQETMEKVEDRLSVPCTNN
jgi:hypothetical protein